VAEVLRHSSSHISETSYDRETQILSVTFSEGREYRYQGVDKDTYDALITSPSKGRAFNALIRDAFEFEEA
jgi:hypothetical protein